MKPAPLPRRGVNLGSWLNLEDFMTGLAGTEWEIRRALRDHLGAERAASFIAAYRDAFVTEADLDLIAALGFDSVRVPFTWRVFESDDAPFTYREEPLRRLAWLFDACAARGLGVLLDFHAAPAGQNTTPPADQPTGYAGLWSCAHARDRVSALWLHLARRFAGHPALIGYNLLNEPQVNQPGELTPAEQLLSLNALYARLVRELRAADASSWIVISGPVRESGGSSALDPALFADPLTALSYHHYPSLDRLLPQPEPLPPAGDAAAARAYIERATDSEHAFARRLNRPLLLGEFGFSSRIDPALALTLVRAQAEVTAARDHGWMLWSWKDIGRMGLLRPRPDTPWRTALQSADLLATAEILDRDFATYFDRQVAPHFQRTPGNARTWDAAYNDIRRGLNRLLLDHQVNRLAALPAAELDALPLSFAHGSCELLTPLATALGLRLPDAPRP
jgi:hypothetical protein